MHIILFALVILFDQHFFRPICIHLPAATDWAFFLTGISWKAQWNHTVISLYMSITLNFCFSFPNFTIAVCLAASECLPLSNSHHSNPICFKMMLIILLRGIYVYMYVQYYLTLWSSNMKIDYTIVDWDTDDFCDTSLRPIIVCDESHTSVYVFPMECQSLE